MESGRSAVSRRTVLKAGAAGAAVGVIGGPLAQLAGPASASASSVSATIDVDTSTGIPLQKGLVGYNLHITNLPYSFTNDEYRALVAQLQPRWGRYSAGTANNVFHPRTAGMPEERRAQMWDERIHYYGYDWERRVLAGKDAAYLDLIAYYDTLRETCAELTIVVNALTGTPDEFADVVRFCQANDIVVAYWELQNEPYLLNGGATSLPKYYNSANDYLNKLRPFNDAIKAVDPDAKTVVAYSTTGSQTWDTNIHNVTSPWWDAIVWHSYEVADPSGGTSFTNAMENGNWVTNQYAPRISSGYLANSRLSPTPILQNELDVKLRGPLYNSQYNAVFNVESLMHLTTQPMANIRMLTGSGGIPLWILDAANDFTDDVLDAMERGTTLDTNTLDHALYFRTVGVANAIATEAINNSASRWDVTITGSQTVAALDDSGTPTTEDALFSTAYQGGLGGGTKNYALVTNKSADTYTVALKLAGTTLASAVTATYSTSTDPTVGNTAASPTTITAQTASYPDGSAVTIPPYSVVRLDWSRTGTPAAPRTPRITRADVLSTTSVQLRWWNVPHATSYTIRWGTTSGTYTHTQSASTGDGTTVSGLAAGTTYYFAVSATGTGGTTPVSNEVSAVTRVPSTPSGATAVGRRGGVATVTWSPIAGATGYRVKYGTSPSSLTSTFDAGNRMGADIGGLTSGTTYYFAVLAYNGAGPGTPTSTVSAVPILSMPYTPNGVRLSTPNTSTSASLVWEVSLVRGLWETFESGAANWTDTQGTWSVIDHPDPTRATKVYESGSSGRYETTAGDTAWGDAAMEAQVEVTSLAGSGTVSVLVRYTDANNHYRFVYDNGASEFQLIKASGGTLTTLASISRASVVANLIPPFATLDVTHMRMQFEAIGNKLVAYVNNIQILTATDSSHASGAIALGSDGQSALFDKVLAWIDNMTGSTNTYSVYRSTSPQSGYSQVASGLTSPTWVDNTITAGHTYYYKVKAVRSGVESLGDSNVLTVVS